jgi:hypothetical protein
MANNTFLGQFGGSGALQGYDPGFGVPTRDWSALDRQMQNAANYAAAMNSSAPRVAMPMPTGVGNRGNSSTTRTTQGGSGLPTPYTSGRGPTLTQKANRSPELEGQVQTYIDKLNALSTGYQQAFQGKQSTFDDVIRSLANTYQSQASGAGQAQGQAALNSGLTPLEANQLSGNAVQQLLQQFYPQQAALRAQQADVPIANQQAQQGLATDYASMMANVTAPYLKGVAGSQQTDYLGREKLAADAAIERAKLAQAAQQAQMQYQQQQAAMDSDYQKAMLQYQLGMKQIEANQGMSQADIAAKMQLAQMGQSGDLLRQQMANQGQLQNTALAGQNQMGIQGMQGQNAYLEQMLRNQGQLQNTAMGNMGQLQNTQLAGQNQLANTQAQQQYNQPYQQSQIDYNNALAEAARANAATRGDVADNTMFNNLLRMVQSNITTKTGGINQDAINMYAQQYPAAAQGQGPRSVFSPTSWLNNPYTIDPVKVAQFMMVQGNQPPPDTGTVKIKSPEGVVQTVPASSAGHYTSKGGVIVP